MRGITGKLVLWQTVKTHEMLHDVTFHLGLDCLLKIKRILGECLLISSLPGKALRTLVDIARLAERFNMRSQS